MFILKCSLGKTFFNSYLALTSSSKLYSKTFSTLNFRINLLSHRFNAVQSFKIFNKPQTKYEFFNRGTMTLAVQKSESLIEKQIGTWLLLCSGMVTGAITLGGYTRLSEAGLSMVTWRFTYESLPHTEEEWLIEFEKYKEFPEFKLIWGRFTGLVFLLPALTFWMKGYFKPALKKKVVLFGSLIAAQGLLGWYMVKSGLEDRFHKETDVPRVSHYRLAAHLALALTLFTALLLTSLELLLPSHKGHVISADARKIRIMAHSCKGLILLTAISGALVAGLDAGLVYNSFPKMGDDWIPDDILALSPKYKNFTENPTTVQFDHRILGITTFATIIATWILTKKHSLPRRVKLVANILALAALGQVTLGISTLVHHVPTFLAISHQSGSVLLLTLAVCLSHELKLLKYIPK